MLKQMKEVHCISRYKSDRIPWHMFLKEVAGDLRELANMEKQRMDEPGAQLYTVVCVFMECTPSVDVILETHCCMFPGTRHQNLLDAKQRESEAAMKALEEKPRRSVSLSCNEQQGDGFSTVALRKDAAAWRVES